ncbi:LysR family transcriptional regulator [Amycolatopsis sp. A1MSW2902]|uniref:LysR family transcriptional regulator n=1 Tax=unclassified Amycolatopsis TaxID=2618356 RepID=UPI00106EA547|nr:MULTISPECIES: LysR family transcriptional regulator [unclassified Amycolatopsis]
MELRQLRYFVAVFTEGSISRAAGLLLMSQPALTRQIRVLERELGTPLFDRVPTGVQATVAGRALHEHARQLLRLADATREVTRSAAPVKEQVEIALPPGIPQDWVLAALAEIRRQVPDAALSFLDASSTEQLRMLSEGRIDIGLIHQNPPSTLHGRLLFEHPFGVAIRPGHKLFGREHCRLRDLDDVRVLAHSRAQVPAGHDQMLAAAHGLGVSPNWRLARFNENALACAEAVEADAVLLSRPSANRMLPEWAWSELVEPGVPLTTWAACQPQTRRIVGAVMEVLANF